MIYVIKKDGTKEEFDVQKIVRAVNKSAERIMYSFTEKELISCADMPQTRRNPWGRKKLRSRKCTILWRGLWSR